MKIAIVGEHNRKGGGSYHQSLKTYEILTTIKNIQFNFLTINSKEKFDEMGQNFINYNTNFIDQLFFLFYSSNIFKSLLKKFKIKNKFEKFIKKNEIDIIIFMGVSRLSVFCNKIDFITYIFEFHHLFRPDLPEYNFWSDFDFRESLTKINVKKSISLIVDTKKKANELVKYYNCYDKKINIIPYASNISNTDNQKIDNCSKKIEDYLKSSKEYFFYPSQYWSHKNHYYILSAIKTLNKKYKKSVNFVFTGQKKNNFEYLNKKTLEFNLQDQVKFFEYLKDDEIKILYNNCKALVMPSLVGYSSLPLYEAFYYKKPVFYTKDLLDDSLKEFVNEIDIENSGDLAEQLVNFDLNLNRIKEKIVKANQYFNKNLTDEKIKSHYINLFEKIQNQFNIYK
jgi:hypothetical protein